MKEKAILIFNHIKLLHAYNTLKNEHEGLSNNFKQSAYKKVLDYEKQQRIIEDLENKVLQLKKENAELKKNERKKRAAEDLISRKEKIKNEKKRNNKENE